MHTTSILAVGSIALDTIEAPAGRREEILGGSATYFAVATSLFTHVSLVGVVGSDFPAHGWDLFKERNIDTRDVQTKPGQTFRWGGRYPEGFNGRDTLFTELGVFEGFEPVLSEENRNAELVYLGNIQPELQLDLVSQLNGPAFVVSDTMNLWIGRSKSKVEEVLGVSDIFLINDEEAEQLTGEGEPEAAAALLLAAGPEAVIIKQGSKGATLWRKGEHKHVPIFPDAPVIDPTGAGDSFAGGLLGHVANHGTDDLVGAVITASATASFTVQAFGVDGIRDATKEELLARSDAVAKLMD